MICRVLERSSKARLRLLHIAPVRTDATAVRRRSGSMGMPVFDWEKAVDDLESLGEVEYCD